MECVIICDPIYRYAYVHEFHRQNKRAAAKRKRALDGFDDDYDDDGFNSQDSDFEDMRGVAGEC